MTDTMTIRELQDYLNGRAGETLSDPAEYARASAAYFAVDRLLAEREELAATVVALRNAAFRAIEHVGSANYEHREREARQWVRDACSDDLLSRLGG